MELNKTYTDAGLSPEQQIIVQCIMHCLAPQLLPELKESGRQMKLEDFANKNIYEAIAERYNNTTPDVLRLLGEFRQPNGTTAIGPGEMLMVLFIDGARFAGHRDDSDIIVGDKHIEVKGQQCRIAGQKFRYDSELVYKYTINFAKEKMGITLNNTKPNQSIQGMGQFLEALLQLSDTEVKNYFVKLAQLIWPGCETEPAERWAERTCQRLREAPRTEEIPDPRMVGRGKNRHYDPDHKRIRNIVASKSISPVAIQCQGELCFARYATEEGFDYLTTFDKSSGMMRLITADGLNLDNVHEKLSGLMEFTRGIGTGNQDNGPQARIL